MSINSLEVGVYARSKFYCRLISDQTEATLHHKTREENDYTTIQYAWSYTYLALWA